MFGFLCTYEYFTVFNYASSAMNNDEYGYRTVMTLALAVRRSNASARSYSPTKIIPYLPQL
jgi:hypothetical protein